GCTFGTFGPTRRPMIMGGDATCARARTGQSSRTARLLGIISVPARGSTSSSPRGNDAARGWPTPVGPPPEFCYSACRRRGEEPRGHPGPEDGMMGMRRTRRTRGAMGVVGDGEALPPPIPLDAVNLVAGIAPGVVLDGTASPDGSLSAGLPVSVDEVGRLL